MPVNAEASKVSIAGTINNTNTAQINKRNQYVTRVTNVSMEDIFNIPNTGRKDNRIQFVAGPSNGSIEGTITDPNTGRENCRNQFVAGASDGSIEDIIDNPNTGQVNNRNQYMSVNNGAINSTVNNPSTVAKNRSQCVAGVSPLKNNNQQVVHLDDSDGDSLENSQSNYIWVIIVIRSKCQNFMHLIKLTKRHMQKVVALVRLRVLDEQFQNQLI